MHSHAFINSIDVKSLTGNKEYSAWLTQLLNDIEAHIENEAVSSSMCFEGLFCELLLKGEVEIDWIGILESFLSEGNTPLSYSEEFGKKLYKFDSQWKQTPIHAIYTHWWIKNFLKPDGVDHQKYKDLILPFIQPSGWIYNESVSPTGIRTRMKSELMMSLAFGIQILSKGMIDQKIADKFRGLLSSTPFSGFLSAEYFRSVALDKLSSMELLPKQLASIFDLCEAGEGYCDFSLSSKVDDYMGTDKRISRDDVVHSAISTVHALYLSAFVDKKKKNEVLSKVQAFTAHLRKEPHDIPAFRMRDIDIPFGPGLTVLEIVSATYLLENVK